MPTGFHVEQYAPGPHIDLDDIPQANTTILPEGFNSLSLLELRNLLPRGMGATPEIMAALAWEDENDEAASFAFAVASRIKEIKLAL